MDDRTAADRLLTRAIEHQQAVMRCNESTPVEEIRRSIREQARARGVRIRTSLVDDVLVVVRADADIWDEDTATMRRKLQAPASANELP